MVKDVNPMVKHAALIYGLAFSVLLRLSWLPTSRFTGFSFRFRHGVLAIRIRSRLERRWTLFHARSSLQ